MSDASDIFRAGVELIAGLTGETTGTLTQDGVDHAFTGASMTDTSRSPGGGQKDRKTRRLVIPSSGVSGVEPQPESRIVLTGDATSWYVESAEPIAPGGDIAAWDLTISDWDARPL